MYQGLMKLGDYMSQYGLDDSQMADLIGKNRVTVNRYRRGVETPSGDTIRKIVEISYGKVTANDLLGIGQDAGQ
jgi:transcriptional regulator with XRE-family HTH domain